MTFELEEFTSFNDLNTLSKDELLTVLKKEASDIDIQKIMKANTYLMEDARFMQSPYREDYIEKFSKAFFSRIKDLKDDKGEYHGYVDVHDLKKFLDLLEAKRKQAESENELCFLKIARVISLYVTFLLEESIHPVGTSFPGGFKLKLVDGKYICPVKDKQMNNPSALCRFCVSVQDAEV